MFGFGRATRVENRNKTEQAVAAAYADATDKVDVGAQVEAIAATMYSSALSVAVVEPQQSWLSPEVMARVGRDLCLYGECALCFFDGELCFGQIEEVRGSYNPNSWIYDISLPTPAGGAYIVKNMRREQFILLRFATDRRHPWRGVSPLRHAYQTGRLLTLAELSLANELSCPVAQIVPVPISGESLTSFKKTLVDSKGGAVIAEIVKKGEQYLRGGTAQTQQEWRSFRVGANPPEAIKDIMMEAQSALLAVFGIPADLVQGADASGSRESYRRWLWGSVVPLAERIAAAIGAYVGSTMTFNFDKMAASDITGRARAFQSLVGAGLDEDDALRLAGLLFDNKEE